MRSSHFCVAAGEECDTAMHCRLAACLLARVRSVRNVFWATIGVPQVSSSCFDAGEGGGVSYKHIRRIARNTTKTFLPPPKVSWRSRSSGARSPTLGTSATGIGGGGGASHG